MYDGAPALGFSRAGGSPGAIMSRIASKILAFLIASSLATASAAWPAMAAGAASGAANAADTACGIADVTPTGDPALAPRLRYDLADACVPQQAGDANAAARPLASATSANVGAADAAAGTSGDVRSEIAIEGPTIFESITALVVSVFDFVFSIFASLAASLIAAASLGVITRI